MTLEWLVIDRKVSILEPIQRILMSTDWLLVSRLGHQLSPVTITELTRTDKFPRDVKSNVTRSGMIDARRWCRSPPGPPYGRDMVRVQRRTSFAFFLPQEPYLTARDNRRLVIGMTRTRTRGASPRAAAFLHNQGAITTMTDGAVWKTQPTRMSSLWILALAAATSSRSGRQTRARTTAHGRIIFFSLFSRCRCRQRSTTGCHITREDGARRVGKSRLGLARRYASRNWGGPDWPGATGSGRNHRTDTENARCCETKERANRVATAFPLERSRTHASFPANENGLKWIENFNLFWFIWTQNIDWKNSIYPANENGLKWIENFNPF